MEFIVIAVILCIVGNILDGILYKIGEAQFVKYDAQNSKICVDHIEDFMQKIKSVSNMGIENVNFSNGKMIVSSLKHTHCIDVSTGLAIVEYDRKGCERKVSRIGRMLRPFRFGKAAQKAAEINEILDSVAGANNVEKKDSLKIKRTRTAINVSLIAMLAFFAIGAFSMFDNMGQAAIEKVKNTEYDSNITYGNLIYKYLETSEWEAFNSDNDRAIVEINGVSEEGNSICIQFGGDIGRGFNGIKSQSFSPVYFEVDGESLDADIAFLILYEFYIAD